MFCALVQGRGGRVGGWIGEGRVGICASVFIVRQD